MAGDDKTSPNDAPDAPLGTTGEIAAVVQKVQRAHRGRIRWAIGSHTAELALRAIGKPQRPLKRPSSSKARRRKRHKRLL